MEAGGGEAGEEKKERRRNNTSRLPVHSVRSQIWSCRPAEIFFVGGGVVINYGKSVSLG
jgi:hypothetical protein